MGGRVAAAGLVGLVAAVILAGCSLLIPGWRDVDFEGSFPSPSSIASYSSGSATIEIAGGETFTLDRVAAGAGVDTFFGSNVRWSGAGGWSLRLSGASSGSGGMLYPGIDSGYLTFDQIADGHHWTTLDGSRCIFDVDVADASVLRGHATCKGLLWFDALDSPMSFSSPSPVGGPAFDAEVTFEATR